ncbi:MAG: hypothetical protein EP330_13330 [Deltaproteobacteria bacterium]|nr:MAG: hypothetical protein EP330_13330 [Deltaproteobacteria bacterium]
MTRLCLALALLAGPAFAQEPPADVPAEPAAPSWPERPSDTEKSELGPITSALASDPKSAVSQARALAADPAKTTLHADAWALRGDALAKLGHAHAAVESWARSLETDPRALAPRIAPVLDAAEAAGDRRRLEDALVPLEDAKEARVHVYAARSLLRSGDYAGSAARARQVDKGSKHFPAAKLVEGAARSQERDHQGALAAFATADSRGTDPSDNWRRAVQVNLARTYFALGNQPKALTHYANVDRGAPNWLQVHFEVAWAHFRMGDMAGTLATLHSLESPFFADGYWAEAELLEAYALFYMCKFPAARERIESFETRWKPVRAKLDASRKVTAPQAWDDLRAVEAGGSPSHLPVEVLDRYTWDLRAEESQALVDALAAEAGELTAAGLSEEAALVDARRDAVIAEEGARILAHADTMRRELDGMLQDVEITKLDLLDLEKRLYESAAVSGDLGMGNPLGDIRTIRAKGDARVWPFQGEYWADEIGYFRVTARSDCPTDLQIGGR